ncbi:MAG: 50S ribosomal protein L30 [Eubacteriaceae bacterium]|jgi:large subunit ribosomal protein L30
MAKKLEITLKRSTIGRNEHQRKIVKSLGLNKVGQTVEHYDSPTIRGMVKKIDFMLDVKEQEA